MKREEMELMAPAGSFESLMAAIQGGADSVYFGVEKLNMRSHSSFNFTSSHLGEVVQRAADHGVKAYLALNTILYDEDLPLAGEIIDTARNAGISALILADQSMLQYAREQGMEVHLSTQLNIGNSETLRFYAQWADVIVLARELNLQQVKALYNTIREQNICGPSGQPVRLELFAHGALCMAVSGKCYLSLHQYNHSANRGECFQACRRQYLVTDRETGDELLIDNEYIMSAKDLCTIHFLDKVAGAGIRVLKIEGRARSPEYVKTVTQCYHEALCSLAEGQYNKNRVEEWMKRLSTVFNRGFWNGYYLGQRLGEWSNNYGSKATRRKEYAGKILNFYQKIGVAEMEIDTGQLDDSDQVLIIGPTTGIIEATVNGMRDNHGPVSRATKGQVVAFKVPQTVRRSDKVYKWITAGEEGGQSAE